MTPRDRLVIPLAIAYTLMWLAAGFDVLIDQNNARALEVFLGATTLEGMLAAFVLNVGRRGRFNGDEK